MCCSSHAQESPDPEGVRWESETRPGTDTSAVGASAHSRFVYGLVQGEPWGRYSVSGKAGEPHGLLTPGPGAYQTANKATAQSNAASPRRSAVVAPFPAARSGVDVAPHVSP